MQNIVVVDNILSDALSRMSSTKVDQDKSITSRDLSRVIELFTTRMGKKL